MRHEQDRQSHLLIDPRNQIVELLLILEVDARGRLSTSSGALLQPPVTIPAGITPSDVKIDSDGTLMAQGKPIGKMTLVTVVAPHELQDAGDGLYTTNAASRAPR